MPDGPPSPSAFPFFLTFSLVQEVVVQLQGQVRSFLVHLVVAAFLLPLHRQVVRVVVAMAPHSDA